MDESVSRKETRTCHGCWKVGHLKKACRSKKNDDKKRGRGPKDGGSITLAVGEGRGRNGSLATGQSLAMAVGDDNNDEDDDWILDSGSSRHLVNDASLLRDARDCDKQCHLSDGETIKPTQVGSVVLTMLARGQQQDVTLTDVYLAPELLRNIMS